jgi:hypothetical protein
MQHKSHKTHSPFSAEPSLRLYALPTAWILAWAVTAAATEGAPTHAGAHPRTVAPRAFLYLDRNRDGSLSRREVGGIEDLDFDRADRNADGLLSGEEYVSAVNGD